MKQSLMQLIALGIVIGAVGCQPCDKPMGDEISEGTSVVSRVSIDDLKAATVSFFVEDLAHGRDVDAKFVGCGVLASSVQSGTRRYFIVTTSHMMQVNDVTNHGQIGLCVPQDNQIIKRLHVPPGGIGWKDPDLVSGLVLGDITSALATIENIGAKVRCVDLDQTGTAEPCNDAHLISRVGVATGQNFVKLGIDQLSTGVMICSDPMMTKLVDPVKCLWKSPTVDKPFCLSQTFIKKLHAFRDASGKNNCIDELTVHELNGQAVIGNSGAPAYFAMDDGSYRLTGIVSGVETNKVYAIPSDYIVNYVAAAFGNPMPKIISDEQLESVYDTIIEAEPGEEKNVPMSFWRPGVRKVIMTVSGECSEDNALEVEVGADLNQDGLLGVHEDDRMFKIGWDNTKEVTAVPGKKSSSLIFWLDARGEIVCCNLGKKSDVVISEEVHIPRDALRYILNILKIRASGQSPTHGKFRVELYRIKEG